MPTNELWFIDAILLSSVHRRFGHSCGHLQGGNNKNTNTNEVFDVCWTVHHCDNWTASACSPYTTPT